MVKTSYVLPTLSKVILFKSEGHFLKTYLQAMDKKFDYLDLNGDKQLTCFEVRINNSICAAPTLVWKESLIRSIASPYLNASIYFLSLFQMQRTIEDGFDVYLDHVDIRTM